MNRLQKAIFLLATVVVVSGTAVASAYAATTPSLGVASTFGVLTHTLTSTTIPNGANVFGDLGYATSTGVTVGVFGGTAHINDATYLQAGADQHSALAALDSQACTFTFAGAVDLVTDVSHGPLGVYAPGVYCSPGAMSIGGGGTVTLSGAGTFIFRPTGALTTSDLSRVATSTGASACDVFWTPQTPPALASTVLGLDTRFVGTVIEPVGATNNDITIGAGTRWIGRALAFDWTVTTNPVIMKYIHIEAPTCSVPPPASIATLHVVKVVINNDGGLAVASDATIHVKSGAGDVAGSPNAGTPTPGTSYSLAAGTYAVSEDALPGYTATFSGDCNSAGSVVLAAGEDKVCVITNNDNPPPSVSTAVLRVIKKVINNNGGTATASDAIIHVSSSAGDVAGSPHAGTLAPGISYTVPAGVYTVSENFLLGYGDSIGGDCADNGTITLAAGDNKTCTVTNDDIAGPAPLPATLHVIKKVINDNGGTAGASSAKIHVLNGAGDVPDSPHVGTGAPGTSYTLIPDNYAVSEDALSGYVGTFSGDCDAKGHITLTAGDNKTCTITNNDISGPPTDDPTKPIIPILPNTGIGPNEQSFSQSFVVWVAVTALFFLGLGIWRKRRKSLPVLRD